MKPHPFVAMPYRIETWLDELPIDSHRAYAGPFEPVYGDAGLNRR